MRSLGLGDGGDEWRGTYATAFGCWEVLQAHGGILAVMAKGSASIGLLPTLEPLRGDVGVVSVRTVDGQPGVAGIYVGNERWAVMSERGLRVIKAPMLAAWRVP